MPYLDEFSEMAARMQRRKKRMTRSEGAGEVSGSS